MAEKKVQQIRLAVQWGFLFFSLYLGVAFYQFVQYFRSGGATPFVARPDGVEAFLPISALVSLKGWLASGSAGNLPYRGIRLPLPEARLLFLDLPGLHRDGTPLEGGAEDLRAQLQGLALARLADETGEVPPTPFLPVLHTSPHGA